MKRVRRVVAVLVLISLVATMLFVLTSCGGLSGTYKAVDGGVKFYKGERIESVEFKAFGEAEIITTTGFMRTTWEDCKYTLKSNNGGITLKALWDFNSSHEETYSFSQSGSSIFLDGVEYRKK